jgi:hypothetical protein
MIFIPVAVIIIVGLILLFSEYPILWIPLVALILGGTTYLFWRSNGTRIKENIEEGNYKNAIVSFFKKGIWLQALAVVSIIAVLCLVGYLIFRLSPWLLALVLVVLALIGYFEEKKK